MVRWTARRDSMDHPLIQLKLHGNQLKLNLQIPVHGKDHPFDIKARLTRNDMSPQTIPMTQKSLYDYEGEVRVHDSPESALIIEGSKDGEPWVHAYPIYLPKILPTEKKRIESSLQPPDTKLLKSLAISTGGRVDPSTEEILRPGEPSETVTEYWPFFVIAAMLVFLVEIAIRRSG